MKEFSLAMALGDFLPVLFYIIGGRIVAEDLKHAMPRTARILTSSGIFLTAVAGILKAGYKLLYSLGIGDYVWMSKQFFPNQAFGFLFCGIGLTMLVMKKKNRTLSLLPVMANVGMMVVGLAAADAALCRIASVMKRIGALICFIVSFFFCLAMGYLSSRSFDSAFMNWLAQSLNFAGQLLFCAGCLDLHHAGLPKYRP